MFAGLILIAGYERLHLQTLYGKHVGDKPGNHVVARKDEDAEQMKLMHHRGEQIREQGSGLSVETDVRIVHDEHTGRRHQDARELELAQFAAGDADDVLVLKMLHMKHLVESLPQAGNGFGNLLQELAHSRGVLVDVVLVPALLQIVGAVVLSVAVAKGDILEIVRHQRALRRREVVADLVEQERVVLREDFHQTGLAGSVVTDHSELHAVLYCEIDRSGHTPHRIPDHTVFNVNNYSQYSICLLIFHLWSFGKSSPSQAFLLVHFSGASLQKGSLSGSPSGIKAREVM